MEKYLGDVDEELLMFVIEHLKDQKGPAKLLEGLFPVRQPARCWFVIMLNCYCDCTGAHGRGGGVRHHALEASHLREFGVWRRHAHRRPLCRHGRIGAPTISAVRNMVRYVCVRSLLVVPARSCCTR